MNEPVVLRLLGGAVLERGGAPVVGRAAQRRRVALLSLLAVAPRRTLSRDRLIAVLWPESGTEQARHLLAGAVYDVRRSLGEDALVSRGDDIELGSIVSTDIDDFTAAIEDGDIDTALARFKGPFLDGFHLGDAPEFERWVDAERDRLDRRHAEAVERLARQRSSDGDVVAAASLWRRLAVLDPFNSRVARELMLALDAAGDRAGALQYARTHEILLREEFDAEPDAELTALAEQLRVGAADPASVGAADPVTGGAADPVAGGAADPVTGGAADPVTGGAADPVTVGRDEPRGDGFTAPASDDDRSPKWQFDRRALAAAALTLLLAVALWATFGSLLKARQPDADAEPSIAVLPFEDLGVMSGHALLGDNLSDEIINSLSRLAGLKVAARTSSFNFRGADAREVGRGLGVTHVLEGTVRGTTERVSVTARLIDTTTGYQFWAHQFHAPWQDISVVQEGIAQAVVRALEVERVGASPARVQAAATRTDNLDAFNDYIVGRNLFYQRTVPGMNRALDRFERAVQRDSTYALAYAAIAEVYALLGAYDYGVRRPRDAYPAARAAAERALELQPDLAEAYTALAMVHFNFDWDWDAADRAFRQAQEANRGYAPAYHWHSLLHAARGRMTEARAAVLRGAELDPLSLVMRTAVARHYYYAREYALAIDQYRRALDADSTFVTARVGLGMTLLKTGHTAEAIAEFQHAERLLGMTVPMLHSVLGYAHGKAGDRATARRHLADLQAFRAFSYYPAEYVALVHIGLGDHESALASLEEALENRSGGLAYLGIDPLMDPLKGNPRFSNLMRRVGL
jgi:TolB-like protein/DNA-binding SARP family transcriptional activator/Tfp pilus assembly protein PilF